MSVLRLVCVVVLLAAAGRTHAQPKLSFKSRELQEGKNALSKLTAVLAVGESSGDVTYSYAVEMPAGRGVTPDVTLQYSAHAGQSEYGWGWNLTIPTIERADDFGVGATWPLAFQQRAFRYRNGAQTIDLTQVGSVANGWELWRERRETTYARYLRNVSTNTWRILRTDGVRLELGTTPTSRRGTATTQEATTSQWQVRTVIDTHGNYAEYDYNRIDGLISVIRYNGNATIGLAPTMSVYFEWTAGATGEQRINFRSGFARYPGRRMLTAVSVSVPRHATGGNPALVPPNSPTTRRYTFTYGGQSSVNNMYYLVSAQLESYPAVRFEYTDVGPRSGLIDKQRVFGANDSSFPRELGFSQIEPATSSPDWTRTRRVLVDVTRDGRADLIEATADGAFIVWRNVGTSTLVKQVWPAPARAPGVPAPERGALRVVEHAGVESRTLQDFVDVTADGLPDLVFVSSGAVIACAGTGEGFDTCRVWHHASPAIAYLHRDTTPFSDTTVTDVDLTDFNGDGRLDYFVTLGAAGLVYLNTGHGFDTTPLNVAMPSCGLYSVTCIRVTQNVAGNGPNRLIFVETRDINGDGLPDQLYGSGNGQLTVYWGTGSGFVMKPSVLAIPSAMGYGNQAGDGTYVSLSDLVDINGDGLVDIVTAECLASLVFTVHYNNGGTWDSKAIEYKWSANPSGRLYETPCLGRVTPMGSLDKSFVTSQLADMNGDGLPELVTADVDPGAGPPAGFGFNLVVRELPYVAPRKLVRATSLNNAHVMDVTWAPMVGNLPYPVHAPLKVTKSRARVHAFESDRVLRRTTTYEYSPPGFDPGTRGFAGFAKVIAHGDAYATTSTTTYHTGYATAGAIETRTVVSNADSAIPDFVRYEYELSASPTPGRTLFRLVSVRRLPGLGRDIVTRYLGQDDYGNVTYSIGEGDSTDLADNISHQTSFAVRDDTFTTQQFIKAVRYEEKGFSSANGASSTTRYYYDNSNSLGAIPVYGDPTRVEREKTTGVFVATKSTYDSVGNIIITTDEMSATTTFGYENTHRLYRIAASNNLGNVYTSYHALLGSPADTCGPKFFVMSGVTTYNCHRAELDTLGRVTAQYVPTLIAGGYGLALLSTTTYDESVYPFLTVKTTRGSSKVFQYNDGFGNPVEQRITIGPDGSSEYRVFESSFDAYGAPQRSELARIETGSAYTHAPISTEGWTYDYDYVHSALSRITHPRDPGDDSLPATASRTIYNDHVRLIDEGGNQSDYYVDTHNRVARVDRIDRNNGTKATTRFTYNDRNDVTSVTDPVGLTTRYSRNLLGWPSTVTTPDGHQWSYEYNDRGHVSKMTEPNGAVVQYTYDALGRVKNVASTTVPAGMRPVNDTYVWCAYASALGELCEESSSLSPGVHRYQYTAEGAVQSHELEVPGQFSAMLLFSYDLGGRLQSVVYPDSTEVIYEYNRDDSVSTIRATKELARILYDDNGQPSVVTNEYGLDEAYSYDVRGRLRSLQSTNALANLNGSLIDDSFDWSQGGELQRLSRFGLSTALVPRPTPELWDVSHDGFARIDDVRVNGNPVGRYRYDLSGRVTEFSELNNPNRTSTYSLDQLKTRTADNIEKKWNYDANGYVSSDEVFDAGHLTRQRTYSWDALGRIASVSTAAASTEYLYTPRGALHAVKKPTAFDTADEWFVSQYYSRSQSGVEKNRVVVNGRVIGELIGDTFQMPHRSYDGSVLATSSCTSSGVATITRQEEFTPYGAHLAGTVTPTSVSFSEHFHGLRKDEVTVVGGRPYDDEDALWLARDTLPQSDPTRVSTEPRLAQMYSFNFGDPMRFRDGDGKNPAAGAALGAGIETARQLIFEDHLDPGRIAVAGAAGATGAYFFGRIAAFGGVTNAASASVVSLVTSDAIMKFYDGHVMTPNDFAMDVTVALIAEAILVKGAQAFGVNTDALYAPLTPQLPPAGGGGPKNVNFWNGDRNCSNCAIALDATLAGNPASALLGPARTMAWVAERLGKTAQNWVAANGIKGVTTMMSGYGAGSRGIVYAWKQGTPYGHFFNAVVNQRGVVKYLDGQVGTEAKTSGYDVFYLLYTGKN